MNRPVLKIIPEPIDYLFDLLSWGFLILLWSAFFFYYNILPDEIPVHFDFYGQPDRFGSKSVLISLPLIAVILVAGISLLIRYPHHFNYLVEISETNAEKQYRYAIRLLRYINFIIAALFTAIFYEGISVSLHCKTLFGWLLTVLSLGLMAVGVIVYFVFSSKASE